MENSVRSLGSTLILVYVLVALLWAVNLLLLLTGRFDAGVLLVALLGLVVADAVWALHRFCRGAMERIRQLSTMV